MSALLDVILPVFLLIGFGYAMARLGKIGDSAVDAVMRFSQTFALPCVLFMGVARLDLSLAYNPGLMLSFYVGAFTSFAFCFFGALWIFRRPLEDAVAIGFCGMFSNSLLLGLPITERAYGTEALVDNYAILSIHSPLFYATGITLMELARARGKGLSKPALATKVLRTIFSQPLVIGIVLGFAVNLSGLPLPAPLWSAVKMMGAAAIPAALFALGGILLRYSPEGDRATVAMVCFASLVLHPGIGYVLGHYVFDLDTPALRSVVMTAAMAPGVNVYIFANLYGVAKRVSASSVLIGTAVSLLSIWCWLHILP